MWVVGKFGPRNYMACLGLLMLLSAVRIVIHLGGGGVSRFLGNSSRLEYDFPSRPKVLPFPSQLVYNRVGKCGSRTVVQLLRILSARQGFNLLTSEIHNKTRLGRMEQSELIKNVSGLEKPFLFTRHVHFLDFTRYGVEQPAYINIIRDPISRFLSSYFFRRFGDWRSEQIHLVRTPGMKDDERFLSVNDCILKNYPECTNPRLFYIVPYFCGQDPRCRVPSSWALKRAKDNVVQYYLLVGILEELEDTLLVLERLLPHYFSDALKIYSDPDYFGLGNGTSSLKKQLPSRRALQVLYQRLGYEYDFYYFVRDQFHLLKRKLGLRVPRRPRPQDVTLPPGATRLFADETAAVAVGATAAAAATAAVGGGGEAATGAVAAKEEAAAPEARAHEGQDSARESGGVGEGTGSRTSPVAQGALVLRTLNEDGGEEGDTNVDVDVSQWLRENYRR
ncbi:uronyl 2-sulfotransferase [Lampetra fluviatilis]